MLTTDLYKTAEQYFLDWCKFRHFFSSHDVKVYGTTHFYDSADRRVRELSELGGPIRRLDSGEKKFRGFVKAKDKNLAWYEYVGELA